MISLSPTIKGSTSQVADYYLKEENGLNLANESLATSIDVSGYSNYYLEQSNENEIQATQWFGKLADKFDLSGKPVDRPTFENMLNGELGDHSVHGAHKEKRRQGYDLTFSAPKGASIMALSYGDVRVAKAWENAVKHTLSEIENDTAQVRTYDNEQKESQYENTGNLLFSLIKHSTSRTNDAQLHFHAIMANMTMNDKGELQNLATDFKRKGLETNGTYERIMKNQKYYTAILHSEFGVLLKELGYATKSLGNGQIDIDGIPEHIIEANSTRSQQIKDYVEESGYSSPKSKDFAAQKTRQAKDNQSLQTLNEQWRNRDKSLGFDGINFAKQAIEKSVSFDDISSDSVAINKGIGDNVPTSLARESIHKTLAHLSRFSSQFSMQKLVTTAISEFSNGKNIPIAELRAALDSMLKSGELLSLNESNTLFASAQSLENEEFLIRSTQGRRKGLGVESNEKSLDQLLLDDSSKKEIRAILSSTKFTNVVDLKNSPKQLSEALLHVATNSNLNVHFIAPDSFLANENSNNVSRQSFNFVQWLQNLVRKDNVSSAHKFISDSQSINKSGQLFVVEHANKIGIEQAKQLIDIARDSKNKIVFLNQSNSTKGLDNLDTMDLLKKGNVDVFEWSNTKLSNSEIRLLETDKGQRSKAIADQYMSLSDIERNHLSIVGSSKKDVKELNNMIRENLNRSGELGSERFIIETSKSVFLDEQQRTQSKNYKAGYLLTEFSDKKKPLHYEVLSNDKRTNRVTVAADGKKKTFSANELAKKNLIIHEQSELELAKGDRIRTNAKVFGTDLDKFQSLLVTGINGNNITLQNIHDKTEHSLSTQRLAGAAIDYNYAQTANQVDIGKAQLWVSSNNYSESNERITQLMGREASAITYFTEDSAKLIKQLNKSSVQPSSMQRVMSAANQNDKYLNANTVDLLSGDVSQAVAKLIDAQNAPVVDQSVNYAVSLLSEREAAFTHKDLVQVAITHAMTQHHTPVTKADIDLVLAQLESDGQILSTPYLDDTRWVTKEALDAENYILDRISSGKGTVEPLASLSHISVGLSNTRTTQGQKDSIALIATSDDRFVGVQGFAGTGKSTMLETGIELVNLFEQHTDIKRTQFIGAAPTHAAVAELQQKGVPAITVQKLLHDFAANGVNESHKGAVFLLDETSMSSNSQLAEFVNMVESTENSRAVWLGDMKQIQAIAAGKPFQLAIERGILATATMKDIVRQSSESLLKAVQSFIDKDVFGAVKSLKEQPELSQEQYAQEQPGLFKKELEQLDRKQHVISTDSPYTLAAAEYLSRTKESRENTIVILYSNKERDEFTALLRPQLKEYNEIKGDDVEFSRLRTRGVEVTSMKAISTYRKGDVYSVVDNYYTVSDVNVDARAVTLTDKEGNETIMLPEFENHKYAQLWESSKQPLAKGDHLVWRKTDRELGITGNEQFTVLDTDKNTLSMQSKKSGQVFNLDNGELSNQHWDYGYTRTANLAQGSTYRNGISVVKSNAKLTDVRRAYIDSSRAVEHMMLFTDDEKSMIRKWLNTDSDKLSALDIVEKHQAEDIKHFEPDYKRDPRFQLDGAFKLSLYGKHIAEKLSHYTESLVNQELGAENKSQSNVDYLVYGAKSEPQLRVSLTGEYRGYFRNFATGERGNMINFLMVQKSIGYADAVELAAKMTEKPDDYQLQENEKHSELVSALPKEQARLVEYAHKYSEQSTNIDGTLAQRYIESLGASIEDLDSKSLRFHPAVYSSETKQTYPAMVARFENEHGALQGIEITYLNEHGLSHDTLSINHRVLGIKSGNTISVVANENPIGTLLVANTELAIALSDSYPNYDVMSVHTNADLRNIDTTDLHSNIIAVLNNLEATPNPTLVAEIEKNLGDNTTVLNAHDMGLQELQERIEQVASYNVTIAESLDVSMNDSIPEIDTDPAEITRIDEINDGDIVEHTKEDDVSKQVERYQNMVTDEMESVEHLVNFELDLDALPSDGLDVDLHEEYERSIADDFDI
ncbi:conjugative transfer relaxase/helicase TraI [Vibrio furnissii]|uniref:conjugative transfer relaxase/helicase TraI n=1 Tax=Vibrio furnissii TaxID=29494 RepID=UPI001EEAFED7|nr:conjugative transfer relaxase/helicase TraI [Vibrio furnissii]MCG6230275.1 conjugative transfer relaxase/helicase TraI [Vibrio furnissii]MCG6268474.1 conjugative transfer relaxase/helicase TraI [Vibrio furnissii]